MTRTMLYRWLVLSVLPIAGVACHNSAYDEAWAECQASAQVMVPDTPVAPPTVPQGAVEAQTFAERDNYVSSCMSEKGFDHPL